MCKLQKLNQFIDRINMLYNMFLNCHFNKNKPFGSYLMPAEKVLVALRVAEFLTSSKFQFIFADEK